MTECLLEMTEQQEYRGAIIIFALGTGRRTMADIVLRTTDGGVEIWIDLEIVSRWKNSQRLVRTTARSKPAKSKATKNKTYWTVKEVADRTGVGVQTVYGWIEAGLIRSTNWPATTPNGHAIRRIHNDSVSRFLETYET